MSVAKKDYKKITVQSLTEMKANGEKNIYAHRIRFHHGKNCGPIQSRRHIGG